MAALGDVLDRKQHQVGALAALDRATGNHQISGARVRQGAMNLERLEVRAGGQCAFGGLAEGGRVQRAASKFEQVALFGRVQRRRKISVERRVGGNDAQARVEHDQGSRHRLDDALGVISRVLRFLQRALERIDVEKRENGALEAAVRGSVGTDVQSEPASVLSLNFVLPGLVRLQPLPDMVEQIIDFDLEFYVVERSADVTGLQAGDLAGCGCESAHPQGVVHHDERDLDTLDDVDEVVRDRVQFLIPVS